MYKSISPPNIGNKDVRQSRLVEMKNVSSGLTKIPLRLAFSLIHLFILFLLFNQIWSQFPFITEVRANHNPCGVAATNRDANDWCIADYGNHYGSNNMSLCLGNGECSDLCTGNHQCDTLSCSGAWTCTPSDSRTDSDGRTCTQVCSGGGTPTTDSVIIHGAVKDPYGDIGVHRFTAATCPGTPYQQVPTMAVSNITLGNATWTCSPGYYFGASDGAFVSVPTGIITLNFTAPTGWFCDWVIVYGNRTSETFSRSGNNCSLSFDPANGTDMFIWFQVNETTAPTITDITSSGNAVKGSTVRFYVTASDGGSGLNTGNALFYLGTYPYTVWNRVNAGTMTWDSVNSRYYYDVILKDNYNTQYRAFSYVYDTFGNRGERDENPTEFTISNTPPPMANSGPSPCDFCNVNGNGGLVTFSVPAVSDVDGQTVQYYFRVAQGNDAETAVVCNSGWQTATSYSCNPGPTPPVQSYLFWHVYTSDGVNQTNPDYVWRFTNNYQPSGVSVSPSSGWFKAGDYTFTSVHRDPNGAGNINYVDLLMNYGIDVNASSFFAYYVRSTGACYLFGSNGDSAGGLGYVGNQTWNAVPYDSLPWVRLNSCSATSSGTDLTVNWNLTIKTWNESPLNQYLYALDNFSASPGWQGPYGTVATDTTAPTITDIYTGGNAPKGSSVRFYVTASDGGSGLNTGNALFYLGTYPYTVWNRVNAGTMTWDSVNSRYYYDVILNDNYNTQYRAWSYVYDTGGNQGVRDENPTEFTISNTPPPMANSGPSPASGSTVNGNGGNVTFSVTPVSDADGQTVQYYFRVTTGNDAETGVVCNSGWQTSNSSACNPGIGTRYWHVYTYDGVTQVNPNYVWNFSNNYQPSGVSVSPSSGWFKAGDYTFTSVHRDPNGAGDINYVHLLMNYGIDGNNSAFYGLYSLKGSWGANVCWMYGGTGDAAGPGNGNAIWNQAPYTLPWVTLRSCTATQSGTDLTVNWNITVGNWNEYPLNEYLWVVDGGGLSGGWGGPFGTVTIDTTAPTSAPTCTPDSKYFNTTFTATCISGTGGTVVRYTIDGTAPTVNSPILPAGGIVISGTTTLKVISCDEANNCANVSTYTYTFDNTAPTSSSIAVTNGVVVGTTRYLSSTTANLSLNATDNIGVTGYYVCEGCVSPGAFTTQTTYPATPTLTLSNTSGTKTINAWFRDAAGNVSAQVTTSVEVDLVNPTNVALTSPTCSTNSLSPVAISGTRTLTASAQDAESGIDKVEFWQDTAALLGIDTTGADGYTQSWNTVPLTVGTHTINIKAFDKSGRATTSSTCYFRVDNRLPGITLTSVTPPTGGTYDSVSKTGRASLGTPWRFDGTAQDTDSGLEGIYRQGTGFSWSDPPVAGKNDGRLAQIPSASPPNGTTLVYNWGKSITDTQDLNPFNGSSTTYFNAKDMAGNWSQTAASASVNVDSALPYTPVLTTSRSCNAVSVAWDWVKDKGSAYSNSILDSFEESFNTQGGVYPGNYVAGVKEYERSYSLDSGASWTPLTNIVRNPATISTSFTVSNLANGQRVDFRVSPIDNIGNKVTTTAFDIAQAPVAPNTPANLNLANDQWVNTNPSLNWTAVNNNPPSCSSILTHTVKYGTDSTLGVDGSLLNATTATSTSFPVVLSLTTNTRYYWQARDTENSGNLSSGWSQVVIFRFDNTPPVVSPRVPVGDIANNRYSIVSDASDNLSGLDGQSGISTTNLITNPSSEKGTGGWSPVQVTPTRENTSSAPFGSYSVRNVFNGLGGSGWRYGLSGLTANSTYSASGYFKTASSTCTLLFVWSTKIGENTSAATITNTAGSWKRFTTSATIDANATGSGYIDAPRCSGSETVEVDGIQFEQTSSATTYCDGSLTGNRTNSWSGSAHGSTSTCTKVDSAYGPLGVSDYLARWGFDSIDNTTQTILDDRGVYPATRGTNATLEASDPSWVTDGKIGNLSYNALSFDGGKRADIGAAKFDSLTEATISLWFKYTGSFDTNRVLFNRRITGAANTRMPVFVSFAGGYGNKLVFENIVTDNNRAVISDSTISPNVWYHAAFSCGVNGMSMYINGQKQASTNPTNDCFTLSSPSALNVIGENWVGLIDEISLYGRSLSAQEVSALYNLGADTLYGSMGAFYKDPNTNIWSMVNAYASSTPSPYHGTTSSTILVDIPLKIGAKYVDSYCVRIADIAGNKSSSWNCGPGGGGGDQLINTSWLQVLGGNTHTNYNLDALPAPTTATAPYNFDRKLSTWGTNRSFVASPPNTQNTPLALESYRSSGNNGSIRYPSYQELYQKLYLEADTTQVQKVELAGSFDGGQLFGGGLIPLGDSVAHITGSVTINGLTIGSSDDTQRRNTVVLIEGDLAVISNLTTLGRSTVVWIVKGKINIDKCVTRIDGIYVSEGIISTAANIGAACVIDQLVINGSLVSIPPNGGVTSTNYLNFQRNLGSSANAVKAGEKIVFDPKYIIYAQKSLGKAVVNFTETPP